MDQLEFAEFSDSTDWQINNISFDKSETGLVDTCTVLIGNDQAN